MFLKEYMKKHTAILTRERSEEEKARRHKYGDKGAKFSSAKVPKIDRGGNRDNNNNGHERPADN